MPEPEVEEPFQLPPSGGHHPLPRAEPFFQDQMQPTPADQWNSPRKQGFHVKLPSGNVCRVKRTMDFLEMARKGEMPNPLAAIVIKMVESGEPIADLQKLPPESQLQMLVFIDEQVCRMMVEPRCMIPPEKDDEGNDVIAEFWQPPVAGCISILDLTQEDRLFLFNVSQGGPTDLASFRSMQEGLVEAVGSRKGVPKPTKRTGGVDRPKRSSARN